MFYGDLDASNTDTMATAFWIEPRETCPALDGLIDSYTSDKFASSIYAVYAFGRCLVSATERSSGAGIVINYAPVASHTSWLSRAYTYQITVSEKSTADDSFKETYRESRIVYTRIFPVFIPWLGYNNRKLRPDVMRSYKFRDAKGQQDCDLPLFEKPCWLKVRLKKPSELLRVRIDEAALLDNGLIPSRQDRFDDASMLVSDIMREDRRPSPPEWAMINRIVADGSRYINATGYDLFYLRILADVRFPIPDKHWDMTSLDETEMTLLAQSVVMRLTQSEPGPVVGDESHDRQWYRLYRIFDDLPKSKVEPYYDDIFAAMLTRDYELRKADILQKFGPRSALPIMAFIDQDPRNIKKLSRVICKMAPELQTLKDSLLAVIEREKLSIEDYRPNLTYALLQLGVSEGGVMDLINPDDFLRQPLTKRTESMNKRIRRFKKGKYRCR